MVSWSKLWDVALNDGPKCVNALRAFVRIISYPSLSNKACLVCDIDSLDSSLLAHILSTHLDTSNDASDILNSLQAAAPTLASNSNAQDSEQELSSIDCMNSASISSTHLDLSSSSNSDSDRLFSVFVIRFYPCIVYTVFMLVLSFCKLFFCMPCTTVTVQPPARFCFFTAGLLYFESNSCSFCDAYCRGHTGSRPERIIGFLLASPSRRCLEKTRDSDPQQIII